MTRILALDSATTTGWALLGGGVVTSGSQCFARKPTDHVGEPYARFQRWLMGRLRDDKPDAVVYEEAAGHFKSVHASRAIFGLRGVLLGTLAAHNVPAFGYEAAKVKRYWTGRGNADKFAMMAVTRARCPDLELTDSNESDAIAILATHLAMAKVDPASFPSWLSAHPPAAADHGQFAFPA